MQNPSVNNLFGLGKVNTENSPGKGQGQRVEPINIKNLETGLYQKKVEFGKPSKKKSEMIR